MDPPVYYKDFMSTQLLGGTFMSKIYMNDPHFITTDKGFRQKELRTTQIRRHTIFHIFFPTLR